MKRIQRKFCNIFPKSAREYCLMVFKSAAENQKLIWSKKEHPFRSYTQLKNYQKKLRRIGLGVLGGSVVLILGIIVGPEIFPSAKISEVYIPTGKGDILIGNISKNQATIIFKTLDSANDNKPLATKAFVEAFNDADLTQKVRKTSFDDYAVTHIIPVDGLDEGKLYYFRITAEDSSSPVSLKVVSSWGDGRDPIRAYATGEIVAKCPPPANADATAVVASDNEKNIVAEKNETVLTPVAENAESANGSDVGRDLAQSDDSSLRVSLVQSEAHLYAQKKVQTIISWNTNMPATTELIIGEKSSDEKNGTVLNSKMLLKHGAVLTTLKPGTVYYFKTKSVDVSGNVAISEEHSLRTPRAQDTILEGIIDNFKVLVQQIKPN